MSLLLISELIIVLIFFIYIFDAILLNLS